MSWKVDAGIGDGTGVGIVVGESGKDVAEVGVVVGRGGVDVMASGEGVEEGAVVDASVGGRAAIGMCAGMVEGLGNAWRTMRQSCGRGSGRHAAWTAQVLVGRHSSR